MTRKEAILALKELKDWKGLPFCIEEPMGNEGVGVITEEALDMAIEALGRKPDIRLKALMKNLKDRDWEMFATYKIDEVEARGIIEAIENMEEKNR